MASKLNFKVTMYEFLGVSGKAAIAPNTSSMNLSKFSICSKSGDCFIAPAMRPIKTGLYNVAHIPSIFWLSKVNGARLCANSFSNIPYRMQLRSVRSSVNAQEICKVNFGCEGREGAGALDDARVVNKPLTYGEC